MNLGRAELSAKIQWLIDIAGSKNVIEAVIHYFTKCKKHKPRFLTTDNLSTNYKNKLVFYTKDGETGHWIYFDRKGIEWNSYKLLHQPEGSNQFCQTFALMYLLKDRGIKLVPRFAARLEQQCRNNNLCVAVDFWRWVFDFMFNNPLTNAWLNTVFAELNASYKMYNSTCQRLSNHMKLLPERIDKFIINDLLDDIFIYSDFIASRT